ncbi:flippase [Methanogenium marinum]|uniref:Flippase n=1 Tax=Methanogenium marinum TaxID=348610 RepID=A0A9Q4KMW4_9EURY|nr:flippase [Methanogenium marinum]MDE4907368.1 flippase [Methanogenium marinum]
MLPSRSFTRLMNIDPIRRQSLISLASTLGLTIAGFIATMYFAHALGKAAYGAYALFLAYYGIFNLIGDGGFGGAAVKRISEGHEPNEYYSAFCALRIALLTVSITAVIAVRPLLIDLDASGMVFWLFIALVAGVFPGIISTGIYGTGMVGVQQTAGLINNIAKVLFQILAVFLGFTAAGLAGGFVAGMLVGGLVSLPFLKLHLTRFNSRHIKNLFTFSFWIFLSGSGAIVFSYADTILIGYFLSTADVGIYQIAFQLTAAATFTTMALRTTLYPKISRWHAEGSLSCISHSLERAITYSLLLAVPVAVGGWILGDRLLYFFYGAGFAEGADVLGILLLVQIVNAFMFLLTMTLNAIDRPKESFYATGTAAVVNILLNLALIPIFGIKGAAIATLATMIVNAIIAHHYLSQQVSVRIERGPTLHILLAAGVMGLVILMYRILIPLSNAFIVLGAVVLGGLVYGLVLLKADPGLHDEIQELVVQLGVPWPKWL